MQILKISKFWLKRPKLIFYHKFYQNCQNVQKLEMLEEVLVKFFKNYIYYLTKFISFWLKYALYLKFHRFSAVLVLNRSWQKLNISILESGKVSAKTFSYLLIISIWFYKIIYQDFSEEVLFFKFPIYFFLLYIVSHV